MVGYATATATAAAAAADDDDDDDCDVHRFHHQSLVEVKVLDALRRFDADDKFNVIHMTDYFLFRSHLCIVFELMG